MQKVFLKNRPYDDYLYLELPPPQHFLKQNPAFAGLSTTISECLSIHQGYGQSVYITIQNTNRVVSTITLAALALLLMIVEYAVQTLVGSSGAPVLSTSFNALYSLQIVPESRLPTP